MTSTYIAAFSASAEDGVKPPQSLWEQDTLTGDWGGVRTALKEKNGIDITLNSINEIFGVLSGGLQRQTSYEGRLEFSLDADLQKLIAWTGGSAHVTVYNLNNGGRTAVENTGSIADPSNIDALVTTRFFTAWFQQSMFDDRVSVRIGQFSRRTR